MLFRSNGLLPTKQDEGPDAQDLASVFWLRSAPKRRKPSLKRKHLEKRIAQALVILVDKGEDIQGYHEGDGWTYRYPIIRLWEQDPSRLLLHEGLLPLAVLSRPCYHCPVQHFAGRDGLVCIAQVLRCIDFCRICTCT